jgi:protease IV
MDMKDLEKSVLENIVLESLQEQKRARRWKIFFRLVWLMIIITVALVALGKKEKTLLSKNKKVVAVIDLNTVINSENDTYGNISKSLIRALKNKKTVAVIIRANSPGGSPVYSDMLYNEIRRLKKIYPNKPIDVVIEEVCASGCYYIAAASDNIYANPASIVGSIGVIYMGFGLNNAMSKLGVDSRLLISGKNKAMGYPFIPVNKEQQEMQQQMLDEIHEDFISAVKNGRGKRLKNSKDLFSGRYWIGQDAMKLGLIDGYATVDSLARDKFKTDNIVNFSHKEDKFDRVIKKFSTSLIDSAKQVVADSDFGFIR